MAGISTDVTYESVVEDQLHPSGWVYAYWAEQVSGYLRG